MCKSDYRSTYDGIFFDDIEYNILNCYPTTVFDPRSYGLKPYEREYTLGSKPFDFVCVYRIRQKTLYLERLGVRTDDDHYPEIVGSKPVDGRLATREGSNIYLGYPIDSPEYNATSEGGRFYHFPEFMIPYSGTMWLGREIAEDWYPWSYHGVNDEPAYKKVFEIQLEYGLLTASRNWSAEVMRVRSVYAHMAHLLWDGLLTKNEHELLVPQVYPEWRCFNVPRMEETIRDIERATYKPSHFIALFLADYHNSTWQEDLSLLLSLEWFAAKRLPSRIRMILRKIIRQGFSERVVLAYYLKNLLISLCADAGRGKLITDLDKVIAEEELPESAKKSINTKMSAVRLEAWNANDEIF